MMDLFLFGAGILASRVRFTVGWIKLRHLVSVVCVFAVWCIRLVIHPFYVGASHLNSLKRLVLEPKAVDEERLIRLLQECHDRLPHKTLQELKQEDRDYESEMRTVMHYCQGSFYGRPASCGYYGTFKSTQDWSVLLREDQARKTLEAVGLPMSRTQRVCQRCLEKAPK